MRNLSAVLLSLFFTLNCLAEVRSRSPIVQVDTVGGICTGFFVSARHLVTAGHCTREGEIKVGGFPTRDFKVINEDGVLATFDRDVATRLGITRFVAVARKPPLFGERITFWNYELKPLTNKIAWGGSRGAMMRGEDGDVSVPGYSGGPALNSKNEAVGWVCGARGEDLERLEFLTHPDAQAVLVEKGILPKSILSEYPFILEGTLRYTYFDLGTRKLRGYHLVAPTGTVHPYYREKGNWTYDIRPMGDKMEKTLSEMPEGTRLRVYSQYSYFGLEGRHAEDTSIQIAKLETIAEGKEPTTVEVLPPPRPAQPTPPPSKVPDYFVLKDGRYSTHSTQNWESYYPEYVRTWDDCRLFLNTQIQGETIVQTSWDPQTGKCFLYTGFESTEEALARDRETTVPQRSAPPPRRGRRR